MVGLTKRTAGRLVDEGERDLLQSDDIRVGVYRRENLERVRHLLLVEVLNHGALERLPNVRLRDGVHHVNENGIENGTAHGLEGYLDFLIGRSML